MVPKSSRESEKIARSWDRKTKAIRTAPPPAIFRAIWGRRGATTIRSHGSCLQTAAQLPRGSSKPPTCDKHEHTKLSTATLTNGSRGNAWSQRSAAILKRCVRNLNWKGPLSRVFSYKYGVLFIVVNFESAIVMETLSSHFSRNLYIVSVVFIAILIAYRDYLIT